MTAKSGALNRAALSLRENILSEMEDTFSGPGEYTQGQKSPVTFGAKW